jgi:hypothetical protein
MVKIRSPAIDTLENPVPRPEAFQANGGPDSDHSRSKPVEVL